VTRTTGDGLGYHVLASRRRFSGRVFDVVTDTVGMPDGGDAERDLVRHVGAVGVLAVDAAGRVVLVRQYRHPVRRRLWELPAGLLDVPGEPPLVAAQRELAEEARLAATRWDLLLDLHTSPGFSDETIRIYLARDLAPAPDTGHVATGEEAELSVSRVALDEAVAMTLRGEITNAAAVAGLLAAGQVSRDGWAGLRPADEPWPTPRADASGDPVVG
jgi:ADP-ribose pyrophosphatase